MDISTAHRRSAFATGRLAPLALLVLLALVATALAVLVAGSRRPAVEPFGLARNGTWMTSTDGDIFALDPATSARTPVVTDAQHFDFAPLWSRDGSMLLFLRSDGQVSDPAMLTMMVMNADGTDLRPITPPREALDWFDWSPTGDRVAYVSAGALWVANVADGAQTQLETPGHVHFPAWLPPDGREIIVRTESSSPSLLAIAADGSGSRTLNRTPAIDRFDFDVPAVAPDGSAVAFTRWSGAGRSRVIRLNAATGAEHIYPLDDGRSQRGYSVFSPDGSLVAYARIHADATFQIVITDADGSGSERPLGRREPMPADGNYPDASWVFTPDGTALVIRYGTDDAGVTELVPLDGSAPTPLASGSFTFVDVQRQAP